ncbi:hypothetical protein F1559_001702 [Cyanidiococcus yangmingshanensis]|uniref:Uncharacterized protein n=1 Tax=Cyanidiococcus yangmingshanensis TaxID=2690220 RepID=A0A7J7IG25_9RHOD|nr:hypothetical protein F1559_001702 [Cyanidiococcus yangmingshanensis]
MGCWFVPSPWTAVYICPAALIMGRLMFCGTRVGSTTPWVDIFMTETIGINVASHIHHNQMDGFAHPPPYPKHHVWHRSNSLGGEIASPLTERLSRSSSHTDGLIYTERRLHSIPRSRSMDADLVYSRASPFLDNERLNGHAPSGSLESLLTIPTCRIGQKLTLQRSQSMDDGLTAVLRSDCQRIHISKEFVSRRRMQILENIAEHSPSRTDEELQEDGRLQETTSNGDRATVFARDE